MVLNLADGSSRELFDASIIWGVSWSPAGDRVAVVADQPGEKGHKIFIIAFASATVSQTKAAESGDDLISDYAPPSWSGDGRELAIELRHSGPGANNSESASIAVWNLSTGSLRKVARGVDPSWSPANDEIAFYDGTRRHCYSVRSNGSAQKLLFSSSKGVLGVGGGAPLFFPLVWSTHGRKVISHEWVDADLVTDVYELDLSTGKRKHIARSEVQVVNWVDVPATD